MSDRARQLLNAYNAAWNDQDLDAVASMHADDVVFTQCRGQARFQLQPYREAFV